MYKPTYLTDEDIAERLTQVRDFDRVAVLREVDEQLAEFEKVHRMSTEDMRRMVVNDELHETDEICAWLMIAGRRRVLAASR
ncbi:MAG: hypothetical protein ABMB14_11750 [Myxococcota bacterium]